MSGAKNNRELYKGTFSRLHASEKCVTEVMEMTKIKKRVRLSRFAAVCISAAMLLGLMSGITYAATGGETVNPVTAVKVYFNGIEKDASMYKNSDGSYTVKMKAGDTFSMSSDTTEQSVVCENGEVVVTTKNDTAGGEGVSDIDVNIIDAGDNNDGNKLNLNYSSSDGAESEANHSAETDKDNQHK